MAHVVVPGVDIRVHGEVKKEQLELLTNEALQFLGHLHNHFEQRRQLLLSARVTRQAEFDAGMLPDFLPETKHIRDDPTWRVAPPPPDLMDRRVEITGPVDRKMVINGLNSGASTFMADFEDSSSPTWHNMLDGQLNLRDAARMDISYTNPSNGKVYKVNPNPAVLIVRPRGWHLDEAHVTVDGRPMSGALFDFGLFFFHSAYELVKRGTGPYFYLPKMEGHLEARLWNDVFLSAQAYHGVPRGTVRATALLETITAAFEMEEMLYELREHSVGLNCGRWDYIFSYIKKMKNHPGKLTPDREFLTMQTPFMQAYVKLLIHTCHKRGAHAMGGMAAQIPVKNNPQLQAKAMEQVKQDKLREVKAGHDGTWVAHPALVAIAKDVFDQYMPGPNQLSVVPACHVTASDLLETPTGQGSITSKGLTTNIDICLEYIEAWIRGNGCIPLNHKMEDAATAEISRAQVWQWCHHNAETSDGVRITRQLVQDLVDAEAHKFQQEYGHARKFQVAGYLVRDMMTSSQLEDFLTTRAYPHIVQVSHARLTLRQWAGEGDGEEVFI
ncbi:unnamed protein product [Chrysoparadoxa australica]